MKTLPAVLSLTLALLLGLGAGAQDAPAPRAPDAPAPEKAAPSEDRQSPFEASIRALVDAHLKALNEEDLEAVAETMHKDSPVMKQTLAQLPQMFATYDLDFALVKLKFVGLSDDYAVVRMIQTTKKKAGPDFRDNKVDAMQVLKRQGEKWTFWTTAVLKVSFDG